MTRASDDLSSRLERPDGVRRLGQALWMMVGLPLNSAALLWARSLLGPDGDKLLWNTLCEVGAIHEPDFLLQHGQLAELLCALWGNEHEATSDATLVWTLPPRLIVEGIARDGYVQSAIRIVDSATASLTLVSPYLEPKGMGHLHESLVGALHRGVAVLLLTQDVDDLSSIGSVSLETLRRDSAGLRGSLTVFSAVAIPRVLLHLKILVADECFALVGSANATGKGFGENLEAGVVLGQRAAVELGRVVRATIASGLVNQVFSNSMKA